jgi:MscS family membrane protein
MHDFFSKTFYSNTIGEWLIAMLVVGAGIILGKIMYWIIGKYIKILAKKNKSRLDDILVDMFEEPIILSIFIFSFWYALSSLSLSTKVDAFFDHVIYILIVFDVAWLRVRIFDSLVEEYVVPLVKTSESNLDDQVLPIIRKTIKVTIWSIAVVVGLNNAGYDIGALIAGLGIGGLALAMAAKDSVENLFGGLTVFFDKPFIVNDRIVIDGFDGVVEEIGVRSTRLRTLAGRLVTIPNSHFTRMSIENISLEPSRKVVLEIALTNDSTTLEIEKAIEILTNTAKSYSELEEKIYAGISSFGQFSINLQLVYYIKIGLDFVNVSVSINFDIFKAFKEAHLRFVLPTGAFVEQK